jgi:glutathione S-transferase
MAKIPYSTDILDKPPQSKSGKVPYILLKEGEILADSNVIIETVARERGIDLTYGRSPAEQARSHAILRMIEESLYFVAVWERWLQPEFWPITSDGYFGSLPGALRPLFASLIRRKIKAALHGQGISRHDPANIAHHGAADIKALSVLLGEKAFFNGEQPGVVDASAYGMLANLLGFPARTSLKSTVEACPNLVEFCHRVEREYWHEDA